MEMYCYCDYNRIFLLSVFQCFYKRIPRALPDCPSPLSSSSFSHPLLVWSLSVCCNHITLFHSLLVCLTLSFVELSGSGAAVREGRRNHSRCFSHSGHLCVSHADAHSFTHLPGSPPVSSDPRRLLPKRCRSRCPDTHRSSPWYSPTRARPQPRQSLSGHSLCWASRREEAFPSSHAQARVDWIVRGQRIPQRLLPVCGRDIPRLPGQRDVEPKQGDERRLPVS